MRSPTHTGSWWSAMAGALCACFTLPRIPETPDDATASGSSGTTGQTDLKPRKSFRLSKPIFTGIENTSFTMAEICKATKNFSTSLKIGNGACATVYKGTFRDGRVLAIKRAHKNSYGKKWGLEFQNEIRTLAQVEHMNLVKFYGCLEHGDERIIIVEYVPNGTLREHLDGVHGFNLDLSTRLEIAIDVAHAITYLHMYTDHPIIHRDIKSSNILLTRNFRAKVADFGFARFAADMEAGETHVSTQVKGTFGYLDPDYAVTYQLTEKSDVYSFGVLLLELITGRRPIELNRELKERITAPWAIEKLLDGDAILAFDPNLEWGDAGRLMSEKILHVAALCLAPNRHKRPSIKECKESLWNIRRDHRESRDHLQG